MTSSRERGRARNLPAPHRLASARRSALKSPTLVHLWQGLGRFVLRPCPVRTHTIFSVAGSAFLNALRAAWVRPATPAPMRLAKYAFQTGEQAVGGEYLRILTRPIILPDFVARTALPEAGLPMDGGRHGLAPPPDGPARAARAPGLKPHHLASRGPGASPLRDSPPSAVMLPAFPTGIN